MLEKHTEKLKMSSHSSCGFHSACEVSDVFIAKVTEYWFSLPLSLLDQFDWLWQLELKCFYRHCLPNL